MEARVLTLDDVLRERQRWCVPVYQRHYAWEVGENKQLNRLWEDIEEKASEFLNGETPYPHYIGAVIVAEPPNQAFGTVRQRLLVDGQQRITTFQLVLIAVREVARARNLADRIPIIETYLFNEISGGMSNPKVERYKLWPSAFDRSLYQTIADNSSEALPELHPELFYKNRRLRSGMAPRLLAALHFLIERIGTFVADVDEGVDATNRLEAVLKGFLSSFRVVVIQLAEKDDAQEIFASLNDLGKPLTALDLIRNDVFHRARRAGEDDEAIFDGHWRTFEDAFWEEVTRQGRFKRPRVEFFLGHFLAAETARETNLGKLAAQYRDYARAREFRSVSKEIGHIARYVPTYRALVAGNEGHSASRIAAVLRNWDQTTFHPLVMLASTAAIDEEERQSIFDLVECYLVRRDLCGLTTKNYNNVVLRTLQRWKQTKVGISELTTLLSEMEGDATRLPSDAEVIQRFATRNIYGDLPTPRLRYILETLENRKRTSFDESVVVGSELTIEHVMPQKWAKKWLLPDGRSAPTESSIAAMMTNNVDAAMQEQITVREQLVNSIGNLTLVTGSLNPSMSDAAFDVKRPAICRSLLVLNREIGAEVSWDEDVIRRRGQSLAQFAAEVWPLPRPSA